MRGTAPRARAAECRRREPIGIRRGTSAAALRLWPASPVPRPHVAAWRRGYAGALF
ncbi:hypothetical protein BURMUCGD2M_0844 [Burkholderia multivorans CGD2M]|uniref:Uncharacterized protein n=1 Tax=Burkholderia multivorans CGD2 TaxID=513052 RepID=B9BTR5_9BURK|nr:hypothetical protein BURMUCGD2_0753 [Burkholderia multivorans CGD2]EEE12747.1 hypothetical protein BURMUCGD2M_0844 [Burkholderia multivorans CGD2M]